LNKRGVSPVVAVLLLIVITVAAAVLVYIWLIGFMQSQTATTGSTALGERIKFESATIDTNGKFDAYVRNVGDSGVYIYTAYLLKADGQTVIEIVNASNTNIWDENNDGTTDKKGSQYMLKPGSVARMIINFNVSLESNKVYIVKVVTALGTEFTVKVKAT